MKPLSTVCHSIFSTSDFSVLACLPSQHCTAMQHPVLLAKASLECFSCFSEQSGRGRDHDGTDYWSTQSQVWPREMEGKSVLKKILNPALCNREVL